MFGRLLTAVVRGYTALAGCAARADIAASRRVRKVDLMTVQGVIDAAIASGDDIGVQVAAYGDGEIVIDIAAGVADVETGTPLDADTLAHGFLVGKGVATIVALPVERANSATTRRSPSTGRNSPGTARTGSPAWPICRRTSPPKPCSTRAR